MKELRDADTATVLAVQTSIRRAAGTETIMCHLDNATLYGALFASDLQPSQSPEPGDVRAAIRHTILALGVRECAARMAQEFGDHPDAAVVRMRWARNAALQAARGCPAFVDTLPR